MNRWIRATRLIVFAAFGALVTWELTVLLLSALHVDGATTRALISPVAEALGERYPAVAFFCAALVGHFWVPRFRWERPAPEWGMAAILAVAIGGLIANVLVGPLVPVWLAVVAGVPAGHLLWRQDP